MRKIAINCCFGGFSISAAAAESLIVAGLLEREEPDKYSGRIYGCYYPDMSRDDPRLIAAIESVGCKQASGAHSKIAIVEIPDNVAWHIHDYDGQEYVAENHCAWGPRGSWTVE